MVFGTLFDVFQFDLGTILIFGVTFLLVHWWMQNRDRNRNLPPGPVALPIVGNMLQVGSLYFTSHLDHVIHGSPTDRMQDFVKCGEGSNSAYTLERGVLPGKGWGRDPLAGPGFLFGFPPRAKHKLSTVDLQQDF